jgi:hypothetical protein
MSENDRFTPRLDPRKTRGVAFTRDRAHFGAPVEWFYMKPILCRLGLHRGLRPVYADGVQIGAEPCRRCGYDG